MLLVMGLLFDYDFLGDNIDFLQNEANEQGSYFRTYDSVYWHLAGLKSLRRI
jgi:hypothetical protein